MAGAFDLATGYVTFKGDFDQFEKDIQKAEAKVQAFNKQMSSPAGQQRMEMAAFAARKLNSELANMGRLNLIANEKIWAKQKIAAENRQNRDENWLARQEVRELRKIEKVEQKEREAARRKAEADRRSGWAALAGFGAAATGAAGGALALGAGGSTLASNTLSGSFELLKTEIGGTFTPLVRDVSKLLQDLRNQYKGMSDETKGLINDSAKAAGSAGLLALALVGLNKAFGLLAKNPLIAAASAGLGVLTYFDEGKRKSIEEASARRQAEMYNLDPAKVLSDTRSKQLGNLPENRRKDISMSDYMSAGNEYVRALKEYENYKGSFWSKAMDPFRNDEKILIAKAEEKGKAFEESVIRANRFGNKVEGVGGKGRDNLLLGSFGPASMVGAADMFKGFQVAGAGQGNLEAEIRATELQNQKEMLGYQKRTAEALEEIRKNPAIAR